MRQSDVAFDAMSIGSKSVRSHSGERTLERTQDTFGPHVFEADNNTSANRAWLTTRRDVTGRFRTAGGPAAQLGSCAPAMFSANGNFKRAAASVAMRTACIFVLLLIMFSRVETLPEARQSLRRLRLVLRRRLRLVLGVLTAGPSGCCGAALSCFGVAVLGVAVARALGSDVGARLARVSPGRLRRRLFCLLC